MASAWAGTPAPSKNVAQYILCLIRENNKKLWFLFMSDGSLLYVGFCATNKDSMAYWGESYVYVSRPPKRECI